MLHDPENSEESAQYTQKELVNDLKTAGTTVTKMTKGNTLHRRGVKSCIFIVYLSDWSSLKPAHNSRPSVCVFAMIALS